MIAEVANVAEVLDEAPLGDINHLCVFQCIVIVPDGGCLLRESKRMIVARLSEMLLKYDTGYRAASPEKPVLRQNGSGVDLRIEQVSLDQLANIEQ